jgi:hypothetical protein
VESPSDAQIKARGKSPRSSEGQMAATIARATGHDRSRSKETHRLGSEWADASAATWRTFATVTVRKDGSGVVSVIRDNSPIHAFTFGPESAS